MTSSRSSHRSARVEARQPRRKAGAKLERLEVTLNGILQTLDRAEQRQLEFDDYPLIVALLLNEAARAEARQERTIARIVASASAAEDTSGPSPDAAASSDAGESTGSSSSPGSDTSATSSSSSSEANARSDEAPTPETSTHGNGETNQDDSKKVKGHGRNGASAYRRAQHISHTLALGVIGARCEACRVAKMYRYREKIVIRIVGQPLFGAEGHPAPRAGTASLTRRLASGLHRPRHGRPRPLQQPECVTRPCEDPAARACHPECDGVDFTTRLIWCPHGWQEFTNASTSSPRRGRCV